MIKKGRNTPFIEKYEKALEQNAHSRVFAPLAECYRKVGMVDHAVDILRKGLRHHPDYILGLLSLAYCHIDNGQSEQAYDILSPLVATSRENLKLQKTYGQLCLEVGELDEALDTYKYLLFMNPKDIDVANHVEKLERDRYRVEHSLDSEGKTINFDNTQFDLENLKSKTSNTEDDFILDDDYDDWSNVDLSNSKRSFTNKDSEENEAEHLTQNWEMKTSKLALKNIKEEEEEEDKENDAPFVTHTLVDLYCSQGHFDKAINLLRQIITLNPTDKKTITKLDEILEIINFQVEDEVLEDLEQVKSSNEGHDNLMSTLDKALDNSNIDIILDSSRSSDENSIAIKRLNLFNVKLQERAKNYLAARRQLP